MTLYKHSDGFYHVTFTDQSGGEQDMNTTCLDNAEAERFCKAAKIPELEAAAKVMRLSGEAITRIVAGKDIRLEDAANEFWEVLQLRSNSVRTATNIIQCVRQWIREMGLERIHPSSVGEQLVDKWVNDPESTNKAGTRQVKLGAIRSFFEFMVHKGWSAQNPAKLVNVKWHLLTHKQKVVHEKEVFTDDEFALVVAKFEGFCRDAVILGRDLGLRLGDICNLEFDCFNLERNTVTVVTDKADTRVDLPITRQVAALVRRLRAQVSGKYLFPEERTIHADVKRRGCLSTMFKRNFDALGFTGRSFHCLRKTYATTEYRREMRGQLDQQALGSVGKKLGHKSGTEVTRTYVSSKAI